MELIMSLDLEHKIVLFGVLDLMQRTCDGSYPVYKPIKSPDQKSCSFSATFSLRYVLYNTCELTLLMNDILVPIYC